MNREQQRITAGSKVSQALRKGLLIKPANCQKCGSKPSPKNLHAHHFDYDKPLDVIWVCWKCHKGVHKFLNWFMDRVRWMEFCKLEGIAIEEGNLPSVNKKTGKPNRETQFEYWRRTSPRLRK